MVAGCWRFLSSGLTKYAANAMLATRISFMNELALLAERVGADIESVRRGIGSDPRIGFHFLYAGCGYGGSCFPKDVRALRRSGDEAGQALGVLAAVEAANERQKHLLFERIEAHLGSVAGKTIALWGLAFKPNTDDMREAPSRTLMESIWAAGGRVRAYDPIAMEATRRIYGERSDLMLVDSAEAACDGADALALVTEWRQFRSPDFELIKARLRRPAIFDEAGPRQPRATSRPCWRGSVTTTRASVAGLPETGSGGSRRPWHNPPPCLSRKPVFRPSPEPFPCWIRSSAPPTRRRRHRSPMP